MKQIKHILFLLLIINNACKEKTAQTNDPEFENKLAVVNVSFEQFNNAQMNLVTVSEQPFNTTISANGYIDVPPANKVIVSALIEGYVKKSTLLVGDNVKKGQLLLTIESTEIITLQEKYLQIAEQLTFLKSDYERQKKLFNEKITSEKKYLEAKSLYKSNLAKFKGLESKLKMMRINLENVHKGIFTSTLPIYAPIQGIISKVNIATGEFVNEADVIMEIIDDSHKHLELTIFEKDIFKIKEKQPIKFVIPENTKESFDGYVHLVGKSINEQHRTIKLHGHINDNSLPFVVGMFVEAQIIISNKTKKALPAEAVLEEDEAYFVLLLQNEKEDHYEFIKTKVQIGEISENWIEIINYSEFSGKQILGKGAFLPQAGD